MTRLAYVNGRYVNHSAGMVHIEDRGYQFADGVYEVVMVYQNRLVDEKGHLDRLESSLAHIKLSMPMSRRSMQLAMRHLIAQNRLDHGLLYIQVTRGVAPRDHKFPTNVKPALVMTTKKTRISSVNQEKGVKVVSVPDIRWKRCDIKSISLLPNILAKQQAAENGAFEAWFLDEQGMVTEGTSSNSWIISNNKVITRKASSAILNGITRQTLLEIIFKHKLHLEERSFSLQEAMKASEAFLTSSSAFVIPVCQIDNIKISDGTPGIFTKNLLNYYRSAILDLPQIS